MDRTSKTILASLTLAIALMGCDQKKSATSTEDRKESTQTTPNTTPDPEGKFKKRAFKPLALETDAPQADKNLLSLLDDVAQQCQFDGGRPTECEKENGKAVDDAIDRLGVAALPTLTVALSSNRLELHDYASWLFQNKLTDELFEQVAEAPSPIDEQTVTRLLEIFEREDAFTSTRVARAVVHTAMLTEKHEEIIELLSKHRHKGARVQGYRAAMTFGRTRPLSHLIDLSQAKKTDRLVRQAALRAPLGMKSFEDDRERDEVCSWVVDFLPTTDSMLEEWPARMMARCGGEYIDLLLEQAQERVDAGTFSPTFSDAFTTMCTPKAPSSATPAQCDRLTGLLEDIATTSKVEDRARAHTLRLLGTIRPDKRTLQIMEKLAKEEGTPKLTLAVAKQDMAPIREKLTP